MNKMTILFCFVSLLFTNIGCKNSSSSKEDIVEPKNKQSTAIKEKWHWGNAQKQNESAGYAQVVKVGNTIYISGIPTSDLSESGIAKVYKDLGECLKAFGASSKDIVKETLYTTDIEAMKKYNNSRKEFYNGDFPAASWVQVTRLFEAKAKLEVDLIAQLTDNDK